MSWSTFLELNLLVLLIWGENYVTILLRHLPIWLMVEKDGGHIVIFIAQGFYRNKMSVDLALHAFLDRSVRCSVLIGRVWCSGNILFTIQLIKIVINKKK